MKRISRIICTLALLLISLGAVPAANAALNAFSPNPSPFGGMPTWYQGTDGVAVKPCLEAGCGLVSEPGLFNAAAAPVFGGAGANFPSEGFYFLASSDTFAVGTADVFVIMALEFTTVSPAGAVGVSSATAGAVTAPFQRLRVVIKPPAGVSVAAGTWTVQHPWGTTIFDSNVDCRNLAQACRMTRDLPAPANPANFAAALGIAPAALPPDAFSMSTFLKSTLAATGALGDAATSSTVTGGTVRNSVIVTSPLGTGTTSSFVITGKTIGMDVQPGNNLNLGGVNIVLPAGFVPAPQSVTITNTTGAPIVFPALVTAGADLLDFLIAPSATVGAPPNCSGATVAALGTCSFGVTFTPAAVAKAARAATVLMAPTTAIAANNPPPVTLNLSGTALVNVNITAGPNGTATPAAQAVGAGTAVTLTVAPNNKKFKVKEVADGAAIVAPSATDPASFTINAGAVDHAVTAAFMPSGDLDASGTLDVADAQKALKIVAGVQAAVADDEAATMVAPLDPVTKIPAPVAGRKPNIGDVLVILRRVVGLETW